MPKMRTDMSAAISVRAWESSMRRNSRLKPRTPASDPTPTATARITKPKRAEESRASRQAILSAVRQGNALAGFIADYAAVAQRDDAIGAEGQLRVMRHQHQRGPFLAVQRGEHFEHHVAVGRIQIPRRLVRH